MKTNYYSHSITQAIIAAVCACALIAVTYVVAEPVVGRAQSDTSGPFTVSQVIVNEISFLVDAASTTLNGTIGGLTGGTATSSTYAVVQTNSPTGYNMNIAFFNNGTPQTMNGAVSGSQSIRDYATAVLGTPDFAFNTGTTAAQFAYTVSAASSTDLAQNFLNNGAACGTGSTYTANTCWMEPRVAGFDIIDRGTAALTGATTTLHFRVTVPNNANPGLVADTYTATATLTANIQ